MIKLGQPKCPEAWFNDQSHMNSCYVNEIENQHIIDSFFYPSDVH